MQIPEYIKMSEAAPIVDLPHHKINSYGRECDDKILGTPVRLGKHRDLSTSVEVPALCFFADLLREGFTVKHAGRIAARVKEGMDRYPEADQLSIITLENGSMLTAPSDGLDISSGYSSGGYVRTALSVDVRNLKRRVELALSGDGNA